MSRNKRALAVSIVGHLKHLISWLDGKIFFSFRHLPLESQRNLAGFKVTLSGKVSDLF